MADGLAGLWQNHAVCLVAVEWNSSRVVAQILLLNMAENLALERHRSNRRVQRTLVQVCTACFSLCLDFSVRTHAKRSSIKSFSLTAVDVRNN